MHEKRHVYSPDQQGHRASVHANACKKGPAEGSVQVGQGFPALVWSHGSLKIIKEI